MSMILPITPFKFPMFSHYTLGAFGLSNWVNQNAQIQVINLTNKNNDVIN